MSYIERGNSRTVDGCITIMQDQPVMIAGPCPVLSRRRLTILPTPILGRAQRPLLTAHGHSRSGPYECIPCSLSCLTQQFFQWLRVRTLHIYASLLALLRKS